MVLSTINVVRCTVVCLLLCAFPVQLFASLLQQHQQQQSPSLVNTSLDELILREDLPPGAYRRAELLQDRRRALMSVTDALSPLKRRPALFLEGLIYRPDRSRVLSWRRNPFVLLLQQLGDALHQHRATTGVVSPLLNVARIRQLAPEFFANVLIDWQISPPLTMFLAWVEGNGAGFESPKILDTMTAEMLATHVRYDLRYIDRTNAPDMHPSHDLRTSNQDFWFLMLGSWPAVVPAILALAGIPAVTWSLVLPALDSEQRVEALQTLQDAVLKELEEFESPNGSTRAEPQRRQLSHLLMFVFDGMAGGVPHGLGSYPADRPTREEVENKIVDFYSDGEEEDATTAASDGQQSELDDYRSGEEEEADVVDGDLSELSGEVGEGSHNIDGPSLLRGDHEGLRPPSSRKNAPRRARRAAAPPTVLDALKRAARFRAQRAGRFAFDQRGSEMQWRRDGDQVSDEHVLGFFASVLEQDKGSSLNGGLKALRSCQVLHKNIQKKMKAFDEVWNQVVRAFVSWEGEREIHETAKAAFWEDFRTFGIELRLFGPDDDLSLSGTGSGSSGAAGPGPSIPGLGLAGSSGLGGNSRRGRRAGVGREHGPTTSTALATSMEDVVEELNEEDLDWLQEGQAGNESFGAAAGGKNGKSSKKKVKTSGPGTKKDQKKSGASATSGAIVEHKEVYDTTSTAPTLADDDLADDPSLWHQFLTRRTSATSARRNQSRGSRRSTTGALCSTSTPQPPLSTAGLTSLLRNYWSAATKYCQRFVDNGENPQFQPEFRNFKHARMEPIPLRGHVNQRLRERVGWNKAYAENKRKLQLMLVQDIVANPNRYQAVVLLDVKKTLEFLPGVAPPMHGQGSARAFRVIVDGDAMEVGRGGGGATTSPLALGLDPGRTLHVAVKMVGGSGSSSSSDGTKKIVMTVWTSDRERGRTFFHEL